VRVKRLRAGKWIIIAATTVKLGEIDRDLFWLLNGGNVDENPTAFVADVDKTFYTSFYCAGPQNISGKRPNANYFCPAVSCGKRLISRRSRQANLFGLDVSVRRSYFTMICLFYRRRLSRVRYIMYRAVTVKRIPRCTSRDRFGASPTDGHCIALVPETRRNLTVPGRRRLRSDGADT